MATIRVGAVAPDFRLPTGGGKEISLSDFRGKKVVLYFYPKDMTSGCTKEACAFQERLQAIKKKGAVVIGVSPDSPTSHEKFAEKYGLSFPLVSDENKTLARQYCVWKEKTLYGKKYMGVERTTFVISEQGIITHIFPKVKVEGHTEEVLQALDH